VTAAHRGLTPNLKGALWMVASAIGFTIMTTLIKYLGDDYSAALQAFYRQAAGLLFILPLILRDPKAAFRTTRPGIVLFRSAVGSIALILSFYSYQALPLADANALSFTRTLWLVPLAYFLLKEPIGPARIGAAVVGFLGVLLMLQSLSAQGHALFGWPQLASLAAALMFAFTIVGMKVMSRDHGTFVIVAWSTVLGLVFALPPALFTWSWPTWPDLMLLGLMGAISVVTQACYVKGMQIGDAAAMSPIDYTRLVFATFAGFVLFNEVPGALTLAGAGVVIASTLFITWREHVVARRRLSER